MVEKKNNIKLFLTWILGIFVLAHAVIPHDHHYAENTEISEHAKHENDSHNKQSVHCFAVNFFILQKTETSTDKSVVAKTFLVYKNIFSPKNFFYKGPLIQATFFPDKNFRLTEFIFSEINPTRGSPVV
ncbi:MAG: hypothetical protein L3J35_04175 [Bacteroidales bacterium]|nr:hypothetical protein [Bacteroidales bacterium]